MNPSVSLRRWTAVSALATVILAAVSSTVADTAAKYTVATPAEQEKYQRELFKRMDADNDGKLTEREFAVAALYAEFVQYDTNKDGKVSKKEYMKRAEDKSFWSRLDTGGNGSITFEDCLRSKEVIDELRDEWRKIDKKARGYITLADLPDLTP